MIRDSGGRSFEKTPLNQRHRAPVEAMPSDDGAPEGEGRQRIDKWLWHARLARTRSVAAALASAGHVRVNGARVRAPTFEKARRYQQEIAHLNGLALAADIVDQAISARGPVLRKPPVGTTPAITNTAALGSLAKPGRVEISRGGQEAPFPDPAVDCI